MRSSVQVPALAENRSDETERVALINALRRAAVVSYRDSFAIVTSLTATPKTIWGSDDMPTQSTWEVLVSVVAHATDGSAAGYQRVARFRRAAGVAVLVSVATPVADFEDVGGWDITLSASGSGALLTVTGDATRVVSWSALIEIREAVST